MFDTLITADVVSVIAESAREESRVIGRRLAAVAELLGRRTWEAEAEDPDCGYMIVTGLQRTSAEVAAVMNLSPQAAAILVSQAEALDSRLPKVAALLADGQVDWRTVQIIVSRTDLVSGATPVAALDGLLADRISRWGSWSRRRVIAAVDGLVKTLDPDAVKQRERAEDKQHLDIIATGEGTAKVDGVVAADTAAVVEAKIAELAAGVCRQDPRSMNQRRAAALAAMALSQPLACRCDACDGVAAPVPGRAPVVINVIADRSTVLGSSDAPGHLDGFGVIDADLVRQLAHGATVRTLVEPAVTVEQGLRYHPTAAMARYVRMRDMTCRYPGCDRPAARCDIDHTIPFNHVDPSRGGKTILGNLKCLCREHHRVKTFLQSWTETQDGDGTVVWTSPTGRVFVTRPGISDVFAPPEHGGGVSPKPRRRDPIRERRRRREKRRAKNRALRPVNEAARALDRARRREIEHRKDRNHHRRMLVLFKGGQPTTSPFMRWVDEPYESETLPPDWRPPPIPPLPDDPPF